MCGAIDSAHPALSKELLDLVFVIEYFQDSNDAWILQSLHTKSPIATDLKGLFCRTHKSLKKEPRVL